MRSETRREFLRAASAVAAAGWGLRWSGSQGADAAAGPPAEGLSAEVLHPRARVPVSVFIDDSTCLVNFPHFAMPQLAEAWPDRAAYRKPWQTWPREIPDAFLREFGQWCAEHGVRGKFSVIPYPACVGWLDRQLPGWSRRQLQDSLKLIRELMVPHWDIHPEMITHTRVIDLRTGRPLPEIGPATMENSYPPKKISVDQLAEYMAYALRLLKNCDLPCEGITTPGGFGNAVRAELPLAVRQAVRDVFGAELPQYFKYVASGKESTQPRLEQVEGLGTDDLRLTVSVPAGTDDWFGNWDGDQPSEGHRYASPDGQTGRMVELIERGEPAVMLSHWPGLYMHGKREGFEDFKRVVLALEQRFRHRTVWMKLSEMARYWAAKQLTRIDCRGNQVALHAPVACPDFTLRLRTVPPGAVRFSHAGKTMVLEEVRSLAGLRSGTCRVESGSVTVCFDLPKGQSRLAVGPLDPH